MKPVLCAGLVCLDQVTVVTSFPQEDTDMRSLDQYKVNTVMLDIQVQIHYRVPTQKIFINLGGVVVMESEKRDEASHNF